MNNTTLGEGDILYIDIETKSSVNLPKLGVYQYADGEDFSVLLFGYSINNNPVEVIDIAKGEEVPEYIIKALSNTLVTKVAHNASFERICLTRFLKQLGWDGLLIDGFLNPRGWHCTKFLCNVFGIPATLAKAGSALNLEIQKMPEGKDLIFLFSVPNADGVYGTPEEYPDKWELYKKYNKVDVETEIKLLEALYKYSEGKQLIGDKLWAEYYTQQSINDMKRYDSRNGK